MILPSGLMEFAIPFFLVLAIVFGGLEIGAPFKNKAAKGLIALVVALYAASSPDISSFLLQIMPAAAGLFIVVFLIGFLKKTFFGEKKRGEERNYGLIIVILALVLVFLAGQGRTLEQWLPSGFMGADTLILLAGVVLIVAILYIVSKKWGEGKTK
jgi:hypothetical protein